jgi:uncharacterized protein YodC (DUF2158 family)
MDNPANMKPGDIVELQSGGPRMTISFQTAGGAFRCHWFDDKSLRQGDFYPCELTQSSTPVDAIVAHVLDNGPPTTGEDKEKLSLTAEDVIGPD